MEHADALREMSVEKYLLGELAGSARESFEEHLFECPLCAKDLKSSVLFARAAKKDLAEEPQKVFVLEKKRQSWFEAIFRPQWMAPALAACLFFLGYQSFFRLPVLQQELADARTPHIETSLNLSSGEVRGTEPTKTVAPGKWFSVSTDLPPRSGFTQYVCSLYSPSGQMVWKETVPAAAVDDTISVGIPPSAAQEGNNTLVVQGVRGNSSDSATLEVLVKHQFLLKLQK